MTLAIPRCPTLSGWLIAILAVQPCVLLSQRVHAQQADRATSRRTGIDDAATIGLGVAHATTAPLRWREAELRAAAAMIVSVAALSSLDEAGRSFMRGHRSRFADDATREIERFGTIQNFAVLGVLFGAGVILDDAQARGVAAEGVASSIAAGVLITPALQLVFGRSRPRRGERAYTFDAFSGNISLPSGHTTQAFAVASVIAAEYDHVAVQVAAYGLASGVAVARMYHDAHFLSDVAAAAAIGTVVGRSVARYGRARRDRLRISPVRDDAGGYGIQLALPVR